MCVDSFGYEIPPCMYAIFLCIIIMHAYDSLIFKLGLICVDIIG